MPDSSHGSLGGDRRIDRPAGGSGAIKEEDREAITEVVKKRENSMSTGIGFGIGILHAATDVIDVVGALGRSKAGIDFEALDNQPVNWWCCFSCRKVVSKASSYIGQC